MLEIFPYDLIGVLKNLIKWRLFYLSDVKVIMNLNLEHCKKNNKEERNNKLNYHWHSLFILNIYSNCKNNTLTIII